MFKTKLSKTSSTTFQDVEPDNDDDVDSSDEGLCYFLLFPCFLLSHFVSGDKLLLRNKMIKMFYKNLSFVNVYVIFYTLYFELYSLFQNFIQQMTIKLMSLVMKIIQSTVLSLRTITMIMTLKRAF